MPRKIFGQDLRSLELFHLAAERLPVEPEQVDLANEDAAANVEAMDDSIVSLLKEMRYGPEGQLPIKRRKKTDGTNRRQCYRRSCQ